ncbi:ASNS-like protein [Mya arenaria]|uniref:Asparagine synthetase [glutamine-hydrolyzing] n=1 Tax=Mya arenaria TaxID=6604 RepID=A0ABY7DW79_MYAAR|nr:ASNS-like protein [Mya arenaria]
MCGIWALFGSDGDISYQCNSVHKITHRGPDAFRIENIHYFSSCCLAFHRLAIVDDLCGMQPMRTFQHPYIYLIYNGEIYNFKELQKEFGFKQDTACDGEVIIHLYAKFGIERAARHLDGVFFFCLMDTANRKVYIGRDTFGVRPGFRVKTESGFLAVCSEAKGLVGLDIGNGASGTLGSGEIEAFPPGHVETYSLDTEGKAVLTETARFHKIGEPPAYNTFPVEIGTDIKKNVRELLTTAIRKRLMADVRVGCLLSGGLDSSLVTALVVQEARKMGIEYKIQTFSVGMEGSPDLEAAKKVSDFLVTEHHPLVFTPEQGINAVDDVIYHLESYDITTVRASVGMYLMAQYIKEKTNSTVILSGEGSDEIAMGYIYFHKAPSGEAASEDSLRLCNDLYMFDVLRADRSTAACGLEVRVPFLDHRFTNYYMKLPDSEKLPKDGIEKHLLRSAFSDQDLLPDGILWRPKEAFSDGISSVTKSWFEVLQSHIDVQP